MTQLETECRTALAIVTSMEQSLEQLERFWSPSKRGSNAQKQLDAIKEKRAVMEKCLRDGLGE